MALNPSAATQSRIAASIHIDPRVRPFIVSVAVIRGDSMGIPALRQGRIGTRGQK